MKIPAATPLRTAILLATIVAVAGLSTGDGLGAGLTAADLWALVRLGDPQVSPDGETIVFVARKYSVEKNSSVSNFWRVPTAGGVSTMLTRAEVHDHSPRWLPDGKALLFLSDRSDSSQIWAIDPRGGEPFKVSDLPLGAGNLTVAPDGKSVAFTLDVFPECEDLDCTVSKIEERDESPVKARIYTELLFRHWDSWEDGLRSHIFVATLERDDDGAGLPAGIGTPRDLMQGMDVDSPIKPFGGGEEFAFSPDGTEITFTARLPEGSAAAWKTDVDLFRVPTDGSAAPVEITREREGWDTTPAYSPDGSKLAYLSMQRPGFEADKLRIIVRDRRDSTERVLTDDWDRSAGSLTWSADSTKLIVLAQETGRLKIFSIDAGSGNVTPLVEDHHNTSVQLAPDGRLFFMQDSSVSPSELHTAAADGSGVTPLTSINAQHLAKLEMSKPEDFWFDGAGGEKVHGWLFKPVGYKPNKSYPIAFMVHGGPQGAWQDSFHYRWNPQIYAAAGYMTLAINFHGSTGYGQAFTDSITGDWGGKPYEDLMKGLDALLAREPSADGERACALGASYGGYMINWIAGHTDRFKCLINHDGVFDEYSAYYTTEELWFPEWEYKGTPWEKPELYEKWSPSKYVQNWKTPMLVIHGANDFRLPDTEGFAAFTALRRQGIPAKLLWFPEENHWVLRPANGILWHETVLEWMAQWTGK